MLRALRAFARLSRAKFLVGGLAAGGLGTAGAGYAVGAVDWRAYALAQATFSALHVMVHFANDYFDREGDAHGVPTPYSGGSGVVTSGELPPVVALVAALGAAACAVLGAGALLGIGRPEAAAVAIGAGVLAWAYSAPPLRLLARGFGELDTALVVATLVPLGTFLAQARTPNVAFVASTLPSAAAMFAMMLAVEYPDVAADRRCGKRNLVVRLGIGPARRLGVAAVGLAFAATALAVVGFGAPPALALVQIVALPLGLGLARAFLARSVVEGDRGADEALAARGVAFFFVLTVCALLAYAAAPATVHAPRAVGRATNGPLRAVLPA